MSNIVQNQHHVYKYYLQQWTKDNKICCLRENKNVFYTNLDNVGQERYFYKFNEFSQEELALAISLADEDYSKRVLKIYNDLNSGMNYAKQIKDEDLISRLSDFAKDCEEKYLNCPPEIDLKIFLDDVYNKNLNKLKNKDEKVKICYAIAEQYCRTNKIKYNFIKDKTLKNKNFNAEHIWFLIRHYIAIKIGMTICFNEYRFCLLENKDGNFITGDQPAINTYANYKDIVIDKFEIYYPVSPNLALLITQDKTFEDLSVNVIDNQLTEHFNDLICNASHNQLFAMQEDKLEKYKM